MPKEKVILFPLSSSAVFMNLFFFPSSVFERLKEKLNVQDGVRVVFLLSPEHKEKYPEFVKECQASEIFKIEYIPIPAKKTFLEKIFYFFYSYLLYTGTTWIMATIGTRPDEPPAGGRWYLAPLKRIIAGTLGKIDFVKSKIVPSLHLRIFNERPFREIFDKYQPSLVLIPHLYGWYDTLVLSEARRRGIKSIGMASGWDHLDKYFLPFKVDMLMAQSNQIKRVAMEFQNYRPENISLVGYPHFDFIEDRKYEMSREAILESLNFPKDSKFILYVSNSTYCPDEPEVIDEILKWADEKRFGDDVYLVIRPYSGGRGQDKEFDRKKFEKFESHPRVRFYKREVWGGLFKNIFFVNILRHSSVTMTMFTTAMLEAMVFDVPMLINIFDGYHKRPLRQSIRRYAFNERFEEVFATGAPKVIGSFEELFSALDAFLKNPKLDSEKRERFRDKVLYKSDGLSSQRVIEHIKKALYG